MTTKAATANGLSKHDAKYRALIDDCLRQFKEVQKDIMSDTWEVLRRVEATL